MQNIYNAYRYIGKTPKLIQELQQYKQQWLNFHQQRLIKVCQQNPEYLQNLSKTITQQTFQEPNTITGIFDIRGTFAIYYHKTRIYIQADLGTCINKNGTPTLLSTHGCKIPDFTKTIQCKDYHYQTQTPPYYTTKQLSTKQQQKAKQDWEERQKIWTEITQHTTHPNEITLKYPLYNYHDIQPLARQIITKVKQAQDRQQLIQTLKNKA